jgi:hypothetical protein
MPRNIPPSVPAVYRVVRFVGDVNEVLAVPDVARQVVLLVRPKIGEVFAGISYFPLVSFFI